MDEAKWDDGIKTPPVDWRMSASLENVTRGADELPEVTNLEAAVRDWLGLGRDQREEAILKPERPLLLDGVSHQVFEGEGIRALAELLPPAPANES